MNVRAAGPALLLILLAHGVGPLVSVADDDDEEKKPQSGLFGSMLNATGSLGKAFGRKTGLNGAQTDSIAKTATAFRKTADDISDSEEYFIGRSVSAQILSRYPADRDEIRNRYVQAVVQAVALASDRPEIAKGYHAQVLESDEINALSAPGGFIFVTTGLLRALQDEDELACVLAHEVAHIAKKHGLKTIKTARLTSAFALLGSEAAKNAGSKEAGQLAEAFGGTVDDVVNAVVVKGYSRDKEFEADAGGALFAQRANYDPRALSRFIARLGASGGQGGVFKTHPSPSKRLKQLASRDLAPSSEYVDEPLRRRRFVVALKGFSKSATP